MRQAETLRHSIGGEWVDGAQLAEIRNPSDTREVVATSPVGCADDVARAVAEARAAFPAWADTSPEVRADLLDRVGQMILDRRDALALLLSREEGKTLADSVAETVRAGRIFRYFAGEAVRCHGMTLASTRPGLDVQTFREPVGVFGLITPWNFPIAIPAWKAAPALAFGNCVVLKPSELTPAIAHALAGLFHEAGAPPGVFNMVLGGAETGQALVDHGDVDGVSFTGSQRAGQLVLSAASRRQARVQMEMGGKNPLVVMNDANFDAAVAIALDGAFWATGQRCTASSRLIVEDAIHDRFVAALAERVKALRVGDALHPETQIGPAVSHAQREKSYRYIELAQAEGGLVVAGGGQHRPDQPGHYVQPTLLRDTDRSMRINTEEVFGPVATIIRVADFDDAIAAANHGRFGLSSGIVTSSLRHAHEFRRRVRAGMTMVNLPTAGVDYHVPFGGIRGSSHGAREQGYAAVEFFTQQKTSYWRVAP